MLCDQEGWKLFRLRERRRYMKGLPPVIWRGLPYELDDKHLMSTQLI